MDLTRFEYKTKAWLDETIARVLTLFFTVHDFTKFYKSIVIVNEIMVNIFPVIV